MYILCVNIIYTALVSVLVRVRIIVTKEFPHKNIFVKKMKCQIILTFEVNLGVVLASAQLKVARPANCARNYTDSSRKKLH